jgi:Tol biopolymer transport system component
MNAKGSNLIQLTGNTETADLVPAWSPNGTKIALTSTRDGDAEIYVMDPDGSYPVNITNLSGYNIGEDGYCDWK